MVNSKNSSQSESQPDSQTDIQVKSFLSAKILAYNLRMLRGLKNLTQEQVAEASGIGVRTYLAMELGECNPTLGTLERLAIFFNVVVSRLLKLGIIKLTDSEEKFRANAIDCFSDLKVAMSIRDFDGTVLWGNKMVSEMLKHDFSKSPFNLVSIIPPSAHELLKTQIAAEKMGFAHPYINSMLGTSGELVYLRIYPTVVYLKDAKTPIFTVNYLAPTESDCEENYFLFCSTLLKCV